jgi:hypothetical protein
VQVAAINQLIKPFEAINGQRVDYSSAKARGPRPLSRQLLEVSDHPSSTATEK